MRKRKLDGLLNFAYIDLKDELKSFLWLKCVCSYFSSGGTFCRGSTPAATEQGSTTISIYILYIQWTYSRGSTPTATEQGSSTLAEFSTMELVI